MIPVAEALKFIEAHTQRLFPIELPLLESVGAILADDMYSPMNLPPFRNSAMDGYAVILGDSTTYKLVGELKAGDAKDIQLNSMEAVQVFTGAALPNNIDTVVVQEQVTKTGQQIKINQMPSKHANIRKVGEQVKEGELVLEKGTRIQEAAIGFLAGLGVDKLSVYRIPKVSVLVTGNELQNPGTKHKSGCFYESNSIMLEVALRRASIKEVEILTAKDNLDEIKEKIKHALEKTDMLIVSGGISVGDYDFVKQALKKNGAEEIFYKVNQKPGKPLWYGIKAGKSIFGLPGNPAASLSCFYLYVLPALHKMMGFNTIGLKRKKGKASSEIKNPSRKTLFLKALFKNDQIRILEGQSSSMLRSFVQSNALVCVPETVELIPENGEVEFIDLNTIESM